MLLTVIIVIIAVALILWGVTFLSPPLDGTIVRILQAVIVIGAALYLLHIAGVA